MLLRKFNLKFLQEISVLSWAVVIIMTAGLIIITINLGRVVVNALGDYQVYVEEKAGRDELVAEQVELEKDLAYYESYEYKKLYARDVLNLTENGEKLYNVSDDNQFYQVRERRQVLVDEQEYARWWNLILIP